MKRVYFFALMLFMGVINSHAVISDRHPFCHIQPDGTTVQLMLLGDEYFHYFQTIDGVPALIDENGFAYYALHNGKELATSQHIAHDLDKRNKEELVFSNHCKYVLSKELDNKNSLKRIKKNVNRNFLQGGKRGSYKGNKKGLVILVNFSNRQMLPSSPLEIRKMFNETGYNGNHHVGSVHDYFYDQSYGVFNLFFDVVGPVNVSRTFGYYGGNRGLTGSDNYPQQMVIEACNLADSLVNFADYDWNHDGSADQVFIIYAGYGEATGGVSSTVWPHESKLSYSDIELILDGIKIDTYACANELYGNSGNIMMGIGTACHEFSHCMGLPDLYDTDYSGAFGMNRWDIMDAGSYSGPRGIGEVPCGYSAYERYCAGWLDFEEIDKQKDYILLPLNDNPSAYVLRNQNKKDEFLTFENRQPAKWFKYVGTHTDMHGMLVVHIDYDASKWNNNKVNDSKKHQRESIIPADNSFGVYDETNRAYIVSEWEYRGDLFPGYLNINSLSSQSHIGCGGVFFNSNADGTNSLRKIINNISEDNGVISFSVENEIGIPQNLTATLLEGGEISVSWDAVKDAISYTLEATMLQLSQPVKATKQLIEKIKGTSYNIHLGNNHQCLIRIKAITSQGVSDWSDFIRVGVTFDGINDAVFGEKSFHQYYDLKGNVINDPTIPGIYVIKRNGKVSKIYIH